MNHHLKAFDKTRNLKDKPFRSLCYAPDLQLSFSPNGDATACCISRSHVLGNVRIDRLDDIWHGPRMRQFREMLHNYVFPPGCETCKWSLEAGNYLDHPIRPYDDLGLFKRFGIAADETERWPIKLEFALSNTCNLGCIMCSGEYSSVLRAKEGLPPLESAYGDEFFEDLARYLPHTRWLSFLGGEPFLQKECHRIWDMMIDMGLSIPCHVTTNGSIYNEKVERLLYGLPFNFSISVDGVTKETVESIRVNVKYETLMENIRRFNAYVKGRSDPHASKRREYMDLNFCVMRQNWHELPDFFLFAEELGARVWKVLVTYPDQCSLFSLPKEELRSIVEELEGRTPTMTRKLKFNKDVWSSLVVELHHHLEEDVSPSNLIVESAPVNRAYAPDELANPMERAWRFMEQGEDELALKAALKTLPSHQLYLKALALIGEIRTKHGNFDGAEEALKEAIALAPNHPEAYMRLAWLRYHQGRIAEGLAQVELAESCMDKLDKVEDFIVSQLLLASGTLLYHQGQTERAVRELDRYLKLKPDDRDAQDLLQGARQQLSP